MLYDTTLPDYSNSLADPFVIDARSGGNYVMRAVQADLDVGLGLGATPMWVYELVDATTGEVVGSVPGMVTENADIANWTGTGIYNPTFLTSSYVPINVTWANDLPIGDHLLPYDTSILAHMAGMMADPMGMGGMAPPSTNPLYDIASGGLNVGGENMPYDADGNFTVPIVTHLHGAHIPSIYDGWPEGTAIPGQQTTYEYDNSQPGALLWYHDHSLGMTRLNVYSGLAGMYMVEDDNRLALVEAGVLPDTLGTFDQEMVIQDKAYNSDGTLYYPAFPTDVLPGTPDTVADVLPADYEAMGGMYPTAVPEFFGNTILVNNTAWPSMKVGQGEVMLDLLNGSDSRFYNLQFDNPNVKVTLVGTDGSLLEKPIEIMDGDGVQEAGEMLTFAPADRLQLMVDFSNVADGEQVQMINTGAAYEPFKGLNPDGTLAGGVQAADPTVDPVGNVMAFNVDGTADAFHSTMTADTVLNPDMPVIIEADASVVRKLGIYEYSDMYGRIMPIVGTAEETVDQDGNTVAPGGLGWMEPATEVVQLGPDGSATEVWEFFNVSADAHPIHLHQIQYQVLGRYALTEATGTGDTNGDGVVLDGEAQYNNDFGALLDTRADIDGVQNLRPEDMGEQDTVWVGPGEGLKIAMTFDRPGDFVWHCHILSHEDHDMMRPIKVVGVKGDFTGMIAEDAEGGASGLIEIGTMDDTLQGFVAETVAGQYGSLTMNMNGNWSYAVDNTSAAVQELDAGESVFDTITITELGGQTHTITVEVIGRDEVTANEVMDDPSVTQYLDGTTDNDIFVIAGQSSDYGWDQSEDGKGIVVWNNETGAYDLLYGFETLRFDDIDVALDGSGPVDPGTGTEVMDDPAETQYLNGTSDNDVFVLAGSSTDFGWDMTEDGQGIVVWNNETGAYDLLYGFETLRFDDMDVALDDSGPVNPGVEGEVMDDPSETQYLNGTSDNDVFVLSGPSTNFSWDVTEDGQGIVVWNNETGAHDLLYGFETLRFDDMDVALDGSGPVDPGVEGEVMDDPAVTQYLNGTSDNDVFVLSGSSSEFGWDATEDGQGIVVWNQETGAHDLLYGFEALRFDDKDVALDGSGPVEEEYSYGDSTYVLGTEGLSWEEAKAEAEAMGGKILEINSEGENQFVHETFNTGKPIWLGFNDTVTEGHYVDSEGNALAYTNWLPGEPNNAGSEQDYALLASTSGQWDDQDHAGGGYLDASGNWVTATNRLVIEFDNGGGSEPIVPGTGHENPIEHIWDFVTDLGENILGGIIGGILGGLTGYGWHKSYDHADACETFHGNSSQDQFVIDGHSSAYDWKEMADGGLDIWNVETGVHDYLYEFEQVCFNDGAICPA